MNRRLLILLVALQIFLVLVLLAVAVFVPQAFYQKLQQDKFLTEQKAYLAQEEKLLSDIWGGSFDFRSVLQDLLRKTKLSEVEDSEIRNQYSTFMEKIAEFRSHYRGQPQAPEEPKEEDLAKFNLLSLFLVGLTAIAAIASAWIAGVQFLGSAPPRRKHLGEN